MLNIAFGQSTIAVDTHIFRVGNRTGLAPGKDVVAVEQQLEKRTPEKYKRNAHHWLILHGRYVCKARKPECPRCVVAEICAFPAKTVLGGVPPKKTGTVGSQTESRPDVRDPGSVRGAVWAAGVAAARGRIVIAVAVRRRRPCRFRRA